MKFRNIAFLYPRALIGDGGVTVATWAWAKGLSRFGVNVRIYCECDLPFSKENIEIRPIAKNFGMWIIPKEDLKELDLLLLISGWQPRNYLAALIAYRRKIPYIVVPHGAYESKLWSHHNIVKLMMRRVEGFYLHRAAAVHLFFESERKGFKRFHLPINFVISPTGHEVNNRNKWSGNGSYIAWFGRYDIEVKGLDLLFNALSLIPTSQRPQLRLHGRDSENTRQDVQSIVSEMDLLDYVSVSGPIEGQAKINFLCEAAAYIHPSRWECHSIALLEALTLGVPTVASTSMHIAPILEENHAAITVDTSNSEEFATAILNILKGKDLDTRKTLDFMKANFSWEQACKNLITQLGHL